MMDGEPIASRTVGVAARNCDFDRMQYLIERGDPVDIMDNRGYRPTHEVAVIGDVPCMELLLEQDQVDVNWQCFAGQTALFIAAQNNNVACLESLLDTPGCDVNLADCMNATPLITATRVGSEDCVECLLDHGANPNLQNFNGSTALHEAVSLPQSPKRVKITKMLLANGARLDSMEQYNITPIFTAARLGNTDCLEVLLREARERKQSYLVNYPATDGGTPLCLAAQEGHIDCLDLLLAHGANPNMRTEDPQALPLHAALQFARLECVKRLMPITDKKEMSECEPNMFDLTFRHKNTECLELLLELGADVDYKHRVEEFELNILCFIQHGVRFSTNMTPLCWLALWNPEKSSCLDFAKVLLKAGARVNSTTHSEVSPLLMALSEQALPLVLTLVEYGSHVNIYHPRVVGNLALIVTLDFWPGLNVMLRLGAETDSFFADSGDKSLTALIGHDDELAYHSDVDENSPCQCSNPILSFYDVLMGARYLLSRLSCKKSVYDVISLLLMFASHPYLDDRLEGLMEPEEWRNLLELTTSPKPLTQLCRIAVRKSIRPNHLLKESVFSSLSMPPLIADFLNYSELDLP